MASLEVNIIEKLVLNGVQQGGNYKSTITGINDVYRRLISIPATSSATLASFKSTVSTGSIAAMDNDKVKYVRITNMNSTDGPLYDINLGIQLESGNDDSAADSQTTIKLEPKQTFMLSSTTSSVYFNSSSGISTTLANVESIIAKSSGSSQVEIFIASA
tara:strand:- start:1240 stop:1719 length:480 start_codon:yes stop_codon:yes gene_type:complete